MASFFNTSPTEIQTMDYPMFKESINHINEQNKKQSELNRG